MKKIICLIAIVMGSLQWVHAQEKETAKEQQVIILLEDKSELSGELVSEDEREVVINSISLGLLTFSREEIKRIIYLDEKGRIPNPNPTRYFIG